MDQEDEIDQFEKGWEKAQQEIDRWERQKVDGDINEALLESVEEGDQKEPSSGHRRSFYIVAPLIAVPVGVGIAAFLLRHKISSVIEKFIDVPNIKTSSTQAGAERATVIPIGRLFELTVRWKATKP